MLKNKLSKPILALAGLASIGAGFGVAALTSAQVTSNQAGMPASGMMQKFERPILAGKVTAISGTTLTIESKHPGKDTTDAKTYSVSIANAQVIKGFEKGQPTAGAASDIKVGDMVAIDGTISGTIVTATKVITGMPGHGKGMLFMHKGGAGAGGTITAIQGSTITLTGMDGKTYTVTADSAKIEKMTTISVSDLKVGDKIGVHGDVSGTTISAKHILSGLPEMPKDF